MTSSPPTRRRWSGGSWSSTAAATATSASTACPSPGCSGRSAGPGPTSSARPRRWRCPGATRAATCSTPASSCGPGAASGLREAAEAYNACALRGERDRPLRRAAVHLRCPRRWSTRTSPNRSGLRRARIGARAAGARAPGPARAACVAARRGRGRAGGSARRRRPRQARERRRRCGRAARARGCSVGAAALLVAPPCVGAGGRAAGRALPAAARLRQLEPLLRLAWPRTAGSGPPAAALLRAGRRRGWRSAGATLRGAEVRDAAARAGAARGRVLRASPSSRCCGRTTWRPGANMLTFFTLPFAALLAVVARAEFPDWAPRALAIAAIALASLFAAVGIWQAITHELFFYAPNLAVSNANTDFFRVTSLFGDPSLYGRHVVLGIGMVLTLLATGRARDRTLLAALALMWAGLFFSYSQSSMAALLLVTLALAFATGDRPVRRAVGLLALGGRRGRARLRRREGDRRRVGEPGHERPHRARARTRSRVIREEPGARRGHRRPAAGQPARSPAATGRRRTSCRTPRRSPSPPSSGRSGSCSTLWLLAAAASARSSSVLALRSARSDWRWAPRCSPCSCTRSSTAASSRTRSRGWCSRWPRAGSCGPACPRRRAAARRAEPRDRRGSRPRRTARAARAARGARPAGGAAGARDRDASRAGLGPLALQARRPWTRQGRWRRWCGPPARSGTWASRAPRPSWRRSCAAPRR